MKRLAAVILTASMGLALAGCSGNPYKEGVSQLESKEYKQADDGKSALSYYEKGLAASGSSDELKKEMEYNVIVSYEKMQNWEKAKSKLNEYLEKYPDDETAKKEVEFLETR